MVNQSLQAQVTAEVFAQDVQARLQTLSPRPGSAPESTVTSAASRSVTSRTPLEVGKDAGLSPAAARFVASRSACAVQIAHGNHSSADDERTVRPAAQGASAHATALTRELDAPPSPPGALFLVLDLKSQRSICPHWSS